MFNIRRKIAPVLALTLGMVCVTGCDLPGGNSQENAEESKAYLMEVDFSNLEEQDKQSTYSTRTLKAEEYKLVYSDSASPVYIMEDILLDAPYGSKEFTGYKVSSGDYVKEGDTIMTYRITFDEVEMAQTRLNLLRSTESLEKYIKDETQRLAEYLAYIATVPNTSKEFADLCDDYFEQEANFKEQQELKQEAIDKLQEEIDWYQYDGQEVAVKAPKDGCVTVENRLWYLADGIRVAQIYDPLTRFYHISNNYGYYSYGQKVEAVYTGSNKEELTLTGIVISSQNTLSSGISEDGAILMMDLPEDITASPTKIKASIQTTYIENAVIIPKSAVTLKNKMYYIDYLTERGVERRYIDIVISTAQEYISLDQSLVGLRIIMN